MKILVTGANGFIGSEIVSKLVLENHKIVGISKTERNSNSDIESLSIDITEKQSVLKSAKEGSFDAVVHCAGLAHQFGETERERFEKVNVEGTRNILELAVRTDAKHFILLSSTAVYGLQNKALDETADCFPDTFYAESKLKAEEICREICEKNQIPLTIFRLSPVLGEKGAGNVPRLIRTIFSRRFLWVGNGENKKSLIYVGDIADACLKLLKEKRNSTEIFNLASEPVKMKYLVAVISKKLNRPIPGFSIPVFIPRLLLNVNAKTFKSKKLKRIEQTFSKWLSDDIYLAGKIKREYAFEPKTSVGEAVERQCEWFLSELKN